MFIALSVFIKYIIRLPHVIILLAIDFVRLTISRYNKRFNGWGIHIYVGSFGSGKTVSMVERAYRLACRYKDLTILTNLTLSGFPEHTVILPLRTPQDIIDAPHGCLVLIDEIGTIFNSRDFAVSKVSVPKVLFQHISQCRKRRMMSLGTTQKWNFLDKQLRDQSATDNVCRSYLAHPYTRISTDYTYDSDEYDLLYPNPLSRPRPLYAYDYVQTNRIRSLYDTS